MKENQAKMHQLLQNLIEQVNFVSAVHYRTYVQHHTSIFTPIEPNVLTFKDGSRYNRTTNRVG